MARKEKLIALFRRGQRDLEEFASVLTPEQRAEEGTPECWAIKDIVGHMAHWQRVACQDLAGVPREPVSDENIDAINAVIFEERRHRIVRRDAGRAGSQLGGAGVARGGSDGRRPELH